MATSPSPTVNLPEGYTLEHPATTQAAQGLPEGYTIEQPGHTAPPPATDASYLKKVNTGPLAPAGQAEKAMGEGLTNKEQAKDALKNTAMAAGYTLSGIVPGVGEVAPEAGELINAAGEPIGDGAKSVMSHLADSYGAPVMKAIQEAATAHPIVAKLLMHGLEYAGVSKTAKYLGIFGK